MEVIVQWACILSPIIAVVLAIWASRSSAKDTAMQIAALEESTNKQIESVKDLSRQLVDVTIKQVEVEIEKNLFFAKQAKQEAEGIRNINDSGMASQTIWKETVMRDFQEKKPERDYQLYSEFIKDLKTIKQTLVVTKKKMEE